MLLMVGGRGRGFLALVPETVCVCDWVAFFGLRIMVLCDIFLLRFPSLTCHLCALVCSSRACSEHVLSCAHFVHVCSATPHGLCVLSLFFFFPPWLLRKEQYAEAALLAKINAEIWDWKKKRRLEICPKEERSIQPINKKKVHQSRIKQLHTVVVRVAFFFLFF